MKVKIGEFFLSNGDKESPADLDVQESRSTQTATGLRWPKVRNFDRQNRKVTVSFTVNRSHASIGAAERFILLHGPSVPISGLVQFILSDNNSIWMDANSCVCQNVTNKMIGQSTTHRYSLIGGMPQANKPTA